jgi:hypothetical protein
MHNAAFLNCVGVFGVITVGAMSIATKEVSTLQRWID